MPTLRHLMLPLGLALLSLAAAADEAVIRKNLVQRLPEFPKIDEVTWAARCFTPMPTAATYSRAI